VRGLDIQRPGDRRRDQLIDAVRGFCARSGCDDYQLPRRVVDSRQLAASHRRGEFAYYGAGGTRVGGYAHHIGEPGFGYIRERAAGPWRSEPIEVTGQHDGVVVRATGKEGGKCLDIEILSVVADNGRLAVAGNRFVASSARRPDHEMQSAAGGAALDRGSDRLLGLGDAPKSQNGRRGRADQTRARWPELLHRHLEAESGAAEYRARDCHRQHGVPVDQHAVEKPAQPGGCGGEPGGFADHSCPAPRSG
jgi:hypothetical protein